MNTIKLNKIINLGVNTINDFIKHLNTDTIIVDTQPWTCHPCLTANERLQVLDGIILRLKVLNKNNFTITKNNSLYYLIDISII